MPDPKGTPSPHPAAGGPRVRIAVPNAPQARANPALVRHAGARVHAARPTSPAPKVAPAPKAVPVPTPQAAPSPAPARPGVLAALRGAIGRSRKALASLPAWISYWRRYTAWWLRNLPYWLRVHRRQVRTVRKWGLVLLIAGLLWIYFGAHPLNYDQVYPLSVQDDVTGSTLTLEIQGYIPNRRLVFARAKAWHDEGKIYLRLYGRRVDPWGLLGSNEGGTFHDRVTVVYLKHGIYPILYLDGQGRTRKLKKTEV